MIQKNAGVVAKARRLQRVGQKEAIARLVLMFVLGKPRASPLVTNLHLTPSS